MGNYCIIASAFASIILDIIFFGPAIPVSYQFGGITFVGWIVNFPSWLNIFYGVMSILSTGAGVVMFSIKGSQQKGHLRTRSFFFASGLLSFVIAGFGCFLFGSFFSLNFWRDFVHGAASFLAPVLILIGIYYKREEK